MNWIKPLTEVEFIFIGIFLVSYLFYFIRTVMIAQKLGTTARTIFIKFFLRSIYFGLLIIGVLGPNLGTNEVETQASGKDIFIAVDVSKSMDANDVEPTRLEKVKFELSEKLNQFKSNRISTIFFSTEAFIQSPLTFDKEALKMYINKLSTNLVRESGTNINSVFNLILEKNNLKNSVSRKTKVVVLITDGEDFGEIEKEVLLNLQKNNIFLFILGVGSAAGGKIPVGSSFKTDKSGNEIISKVDFDFLQKLAFSQKGAFFQLNNQQNKVNELIKAIENLNDNRIDLRKMTVINNKYPYFLIVALFLMVIDILVTIRTIKL